MSMTPILHPSGAIAFGRLLHMRAPGIILPAGEIRLFHGRHTGPNRGFGAAHIWAEHEREMVAAGFPEFGNVAGYVATIVREGTPVFFGDHSWRSLRVLVLHSAKDCFPTAATVATLHWRLTAFCTPSP